MNLAFIFFCPILACIKTLLLTLTPFKTFFPFSNRDQSTSMGCPSAPTTRFSSLLTPSLVQVNYLTNQIVIIQFLLFQMSFPDVSLLIMPSLKLPPLVLLILSSPTPFLTLPTELIPLHPSLASTLTFYFLLESLPLP